MKKPNLWRRLRNLWRLSTIDTVEEFEEKSKGLFKFKKLATFIDPKSEVEKLADLIEKKNE